LGDTFSGDSLIIALIQIWEGWNSLKIVVAMDSFKESLSAVRVCDIVAKTIRSIVPHAEVVTKPMATAAEGTAIVLMSASEDNGSTQPLWARCRK